MVGHTFEFNPAVRELKHRIGLGELGRVYYINLSRLNLGLYRSDVNVIWDLAAHDVSIMNYLLDAVPFCCRRVGFEERVGGRRRPGLRSAPV